MHRIEPLDAIVLCGGPGTRLRSVLPDNHPKALAEIGGRPFLDWLLEALHDRGVRRAVLATGVGAELIAAHLAHTSTRGLEVRCVAETAPLGTGGAARNALAATEGGRVLVLNGDSFTPFEPTELTVANGAAALWLVPVPDAGRYGSVELEPDGTVRAFVEKGGVGPGLISAGIYLFERQLLSALPAGRAVSLEREVLPGLVGQGLRGVVGAGPFIDIGTPESYAQAPAFFSGLAAAS